MPVWLFMSYLKPVCRYLKHSIHSQSADQENLDFSR